MNNNTPQKISSETVLQENYDPARDDLSMHYEVDGDFTIPFLRTVSPLKALLEIKQKKQLEVILIIPTKNEEKTIGTTLDNVLPLQQAGLLDVIRVIDNSDDNTEEEVKKRGVPFDHAADIFASYGLEYLPGKGSNLYAAAMQYKKPSQVLIFADADFGVKASQIQGVLSPLLEDSVIQISFAWMKRVTKRGNENGQSTIGGRATAHAFKPNMRVYYPELNGLQQPICGLYAARADALATCQFTNGFGIETLLITQFVEKYGVEAFAQVFCGEKKQLGQTDHNIVLMCQSIVHVIIERAMLAKRKPVQVEEVIFYPIRVDSETGKVTIRQSIDKLPQVILDTPDSLT